MPEPSHTEVLKEIREPVHEYFNSTKVHITEYMYRRTYVHTYVHVGMWVSKAYK